VSTKNNMKSVDCINISPPYFVSSSTTMYSRNRVGREGFSLALRHVEDAAWSEQIFRECEGESIKKFPAR
jgi:DNA modification methylase